MTDKPIFYEKQTWFTQWWIWVILIALNTLVFYGAYQQIILEAPFGDNPMSDNGLVITLILIVLLTTFFASMRLETEIFHDGIYVRFYPIQLQMRFYAWNDIASAEVRKYSPISEFGGWGLRFGMKGKAINMSGNRGIQLEFKNGKMLLIGTRKPEEAEAALRKARG